MPVCKQLFSLISLLSIAVILASFQASANALSLESHSNHARNFHQHNSLAKKKRMTNQKRCKSRPTPSVASSAVAAPPKSSAAPSQSPAAHSAPAPAAPPAPPKSSSSPPPPKSSPASPPPPQSTPSSSGSTSNLDQLFPRKYLLAWGGSPQQLSSWSMDAYYNWGVTASGSGGPKTFMPMFWGVKNQDSWVANVLNADTPFLAVKSMNEPEIVDQGTIDPQTAATVWNQFILPLAAKGTSLGCPAVTDDSNAQPWLDEFFGACNNGHDKCNCHFLDLHWYGKKSSDFITFLEGMHNKYNLDVMVSEFACEDFSGQNNQCDPQDVTNLANDMVAYFQKTPWIKAYGAFGAMKDLGNVNADNSLMTSSGAPNQLAELYYPGI